MTTLAHIIAADAATRKAKRVTIVSFAALAVIIGVTSGLVCSQPGGTLFVPAFAKDFNQGPGLRSESGGRKANEVYHGLMRGSVQCVVDDDQHLQAHEIANRIES